MALAVLASGVLAQAVLAGLFLSGVHQARLAHVVVGWLLPYLAAGVVAVAVVGHVRRTCRPGHAIAVYPLPVLLWTQEVLGHLPMPVSTAIHVPLGVVLVLYPALLATLVATSSRTR